MSYLPNIRELYKRKFNGEKTEEVNAYYQGFLKDEDSAVLAGYDYALQDVGNLLAYNLYDAEGFEYTSFDISKVDSSALSRYIDDNNYDPIEEGDMEELSKLSSETKLLFVLYRAIATTLENQRNEFGIGLTESTDEDVLESNKKAFLEGKYNNSAVIAEKDVYGSSFNENE